MVKRKKKEHHLNNNGEYSLTSNNILDKIHNGSKKNMKFILSLLVY